MHLSVAVLRSPEGFDYTGLISEFDAPVLSAEPNSPGPRSETPVQSTPASAPSANFNPAGMKLSASSASGWQEGRDGHQSQESLNSQGKNTQRSSGKKNSIYKAKTQVPLSDLFPLTISILTWFVYLFSSPSSHLIWVENCRFLRVPAKRFWRGKSKQKPTQTRVVHSLGNDTNACLWGCVRLRLRFPFFCFLNPKMWRMDWFLFTVLLM